MYEWQQQIQKIVDEIDRCIQRHEDEALTLRALAASLGYSEFYATRKFREVSGMALRDYLRQRRLAFALKEVRDSRRLFLDIAVDYGFSSHEAFTRAFREAYGLTPSQYRKKPVPVVLRTKINPFDRYFFGLGEIGMVKTTNGVKVYFVTIPAHKFLHIKNYESNGYWDFWQKQNRIPGQDCATICGLLDSIPGKLDDLGGSEVDSASGHVMGYISDPAGRLCDWGFPRSECYGARLPADYSGEIPPQMLLLDVPEAEYLVFEHGPFDYEQECRTVEDRLERAMASFDFAGTGYQYDTPPRPGAVLLPRPRPLLEVHPPGAPGVTPQGRPSVGRASFVRKAARLIWPVVLLCPGTASRHAFAGRGPPCPAGRGGLFRCRGGNGRGDLAGRASPDRQPAHLPPFACKRAEFSL